MDVPNYQQLLAEQYEENARNLLIYPNDYEEDDVDEHAQEDYDLKDVPDKEEFNRVQERHDLKNVITPKQPFDDKSKLSVRYNKDVQNIVINVDSRFRNAINATSSSNPIINPQTSTNFTFRTSRIYKNIISAKLTSLEFPNTFKTFSASRGNTIFNVTVGSTTATLTIGDGNYLLSGSSQIIDYDLIRADLALQLTTAFPLESFLVTFASNRITISNGNPFSLIFASPTTVPNLGLVSSSLYNGLGTYLGFLNYSYTGLTSYTAEVAPQLIGDAYIYLSINDWNNIEHQDLNQTNFTAFIKILLLNGKDQMIFDTSTNNTTSKVYHFTQPVNVNNLQIQFIDAFGVIIDLDNANVSMTLEFQQVLNSALYEKMREI